MPARILGRGPRLNDARGAALLVAAAFCALRGIAYLPALFPDVELQPGLRLLTANTPIEVWAYIWLAAAVICVVSAFRVKDWPGWAAVIGMSIAWGITYFIGWLDSLSIEPNREWLTAGTYLGPWIIIAILSALSASGRPNKKLSDL